MKILVVDDNDIMITVFQNILTGYKVFTADSADKALEILRYQEFDLVITDYHMPEKNGFYLLEKMRTAPEYMINKNTPAIICTADHDEQLMEQAKLKKLKISQFIHKPFTKEQIISAIQNMDMIIF